MNNKINARFNLSITSMIQPADYNKNNMYCGTYYYPGSDEYENVAFYLNNEDLNEIDEEYIEEYDFDDDGNLYYWWGATEDYGYIKKVVRTDDEIHVVTAEDIIKLNITELNDKITMMHMSDIDQYTLYEINNIKNNVVTKLIITIE